MHVPHFLLAAGVRPPGGAHESGIPTGAFCRTSVAFHGSHHAVLAIDGELDLVGAPEVDQLLAGLAIAGVRHVTVDAAAVSFIDGAGLVVLERHSVSFTRRGGGLLVAPASAVVARLVRLVGDSPISLDPAAPHL